MTRKHQIGGARGTEPINRELLLRAFDQSGRLQLCGTLFAVDRQISATVHAVYGDLHAPGGKVLSVAGSLSGLSFISKPKRTGRPPKEMRNAAAYMAFQWFMVQTVERNEAAARKRVLEHWQSRGWAGMPDESATNRLIREGRKVVMSSRPFPSACVRYVTHDGQDGAVILIPDDCCAKESDRLEGDGLCWLWRPAIEEADFGRVSFSCVLTG